MGCIVLDMPGAMWDESEPGESGGEDYSLKILGVAAQPTEEPGVLDLVIRTSRGDLSALFHVVEGGFGAAVFVSGAMGGTDGPAGRLYPRLAAALAERGVSSLRLDYREPNSFIECVLDVLAGTSFLKGIGASDLVLVGHSFGGAVAIRAGELSPAVRGVASMSPQLYGTNSVKGLGKPLLLLHGASDTILHHEASEDIYRRAGEPKELVLYEGTGHGMTEAAGEVWDELMEWIPARLNGERAASARREVRPGQELADTN